MERINKTLQLNRPRTTETTGSSCTACSKICLSDSRFSRNSCMLVHAEFHKNPTNGFAGYWITAYRQKTRQAMYVST